MEDNGSAEIKKGLQPASGTAEDVVEAIDNDSFDESEEQELQALETLKKEANAGKGKATAKDAKVGLADKADSTEVPQAEEIAENKSDNSATEDKVTKPEPKKKYNLVPQFRLNQYARKLRAQEAEFAEYKKQAEERYQQLLKSINPQQSNNQPVTREMLEQHMAEQNARMERARQADEAIYWLKTQQQEVEQLLGSKLDDGFYEDIQAIIKEKGWLKEDPRASVPAAFEIWKKEALQEQIEESREQSPAASQTSNESAKVVKSPEQIRNEQKDKATPITKTNKAKPEKSIKDYTEEELEEMSLEQIEKLAGRTNRTIGRRI